MSMQKQATTWADQYFELFKDYLKLELGILDHKGVPYQIVYDYINELPARVKIYLEDKIKKFTPTEDRKISDEAKREGRKLAEVIASRNKIFIGLAVAHLEEKAKHYDYEFGRHGSVPEDIGKKLKATAEWLNRKIVTPDN